MCDQCDYLNNSNGTPSSNLQCWSKHISLSVLTLKPRWYLEHHEDFKPTSTPSSAVGATVVLWRSRELQANSCSRSRPDTILLAYQSSDQNTGGSKHCAKVSLHRCQRIEHHGPAVTPPYSTRWRNRVCRACWASQQNTRYTIPGLRAEVMLLEESRRVWNESTQTSRVLEQACSSTHHAENFSSTPPHRQMLSSTVTFPTDTNRV